MWRRVRISSIQYIRRSVVPGRRGRGSVPGRIGRLGTTSFHQGSVGEGGASERRRKRRRGRGRGRGRSGHLISRYCILLLHLHVWHVPAALEEAVLREDLVTAQDTVAEEDVIQLIVPWVIGDVALGNKPDVAPTFSTDAIRCDRTQAVGEEL